MSQSTQQHGWVPIDEVVNLYLDQSEQGIHKFYKCWHLAFSGMEDLGLDFFYQVKSVKLPVNANKTVTLPADFLSYTKFGWLNGAGEVAPLKYNDKLTTFRDNNPNRIADTAGYNFANVYSVSSPVFFNFYNGSGYTNLYGIPSGSNFGGGFKVDTANNVIVLDPMYAWDNMVLEYLASPKEGESYMIPVQFKEALKWWIAWHDISMLPNSRRGSLGDKQSRRSEYYNERRKGWARYQPFNLDQAYITTQQGSRLTVKA